MTPRPPTHREPTDEEMQCLPEGTLTWHESIKSWQPSYRVGKESACDCDPSFYAVPITKQEEAQEPRKTLRDEFAMAALSGLLATPRQDFTADEFASEPMKHWPDFAKGAYQLADAMLAARNNQPEKV